MPTSARSDARLLLFGALAFLALGGGVLFTLLLLSQREVPRDRPAPRAAQPARVVAPQVDPVEPTPAQIEVASPPTSTPDHGSLPGRWGLPHAPVSIVVYDDFQCPFCRRLDQTLLALHERYPTQVEVYHRDMPLDFHAQARGAHIAARCAGQQGAFWPMHDLLFANPTALDTESLRRWANALDLDMPAFEGCLESPAAALAVGADLAAAQALGIRGTPTSFVHGERLDGAQPQAAFEEAIEAALASPGLR